MFNNNRIVTNNITIQEAVRNFLSQIGEDPERDGLCETPKRFEDALKYFLSGYHRSLESENKLFDNSARYKDIIVLKNIDFFSLCEHHLLPFFGYAHIGYIPGEKVIGISKLSRAVEIYARRLQDQETMGAQIANVLKMVGEAKGVAVLIEAKHFCNIARGVEKKMSIMTTFFFNGVFEDSADLRDRFMKMAENRESI